jgi:hypothetical protein
MHFPINHDKGKKKRGAKPMRKSVAIRLLLPFLIIVITSCGCYDQRSKTNYGSSKMGDQVDGPRAYGAQYAGDGPIVHSISSMTFKQDLSDLISALPGVNTALVMRTDTNAYVAILLDNTATGTRGGNAKTETNNSGTDLGEYNPYTFNQGMDGNLLTSGFNNYDTVENHEDLSHGLKQTIALAIRNADPSIHDVFISANRDFINLTNMIAQEAWKGNTLQPYINMFEGAINQQFNTFERGSIPNKSKMPKITN